MVEQPVTEPTLVCPPSRRDQRQACPENLQGPRNPFHKISTEPVAPADWSEKPRQTLIFIFMRRVFAPSKSLGAIL